MKKKNCDRTRFDLVMIAMITAAVAICGVFLSAPEVSATGRLNTSSQTASTTRSADSASDPDANVSEVTVSSNPQQTLGTVGFSESNTKRITVGKSTVLYLSIRDMGYDYHTQFETSDKTIATVQKIDNRAVKVVGLKSGTVTITATVPKSETVTISAKYVLEVGEREETASEGQSERVSSAEGAGIVDDVSDNTDLDLYSSTTDPMLLEYAKNRRNSSAASLLLGLIGWGMILFAVGYVFSVVIRSRTPKLNVSPGSRRRYSAGGSGSMRSENRLLPNKYYRNLKKY
ncbi:MAG: hypothetical protein IJM51_05470 [Clostridia bacterium]|nr:hypothetical protein [Clostridia bacterium]